MSGGPRISFNAIDSALTSLKNCQSYINSGMDVATQVALDLVESFSKYILSCIVYLNLTDESQTYVFWLSYC